VARVLIVGCGCRGTALASELLGRGYAVRGTTRRDAGCARIAAAGAEAFVGDPDRVGTIAPALVGVSVACILLGSARGSADHVAELHGSRLEMLLQRIIDTSVRGVIYEASGSVDRAVLSGGAEIVGAACRLSRIPHALLEFGPREPWPAAAADAVEGVLAPR
jgi:nucleoside-diphosphate-sugar epimerase